MYGRLPAGHSATASSHQPADTTIATPAASSCRMRRQSVVGAAHRYAAASAGQHEEGLQHLRQEPEARGTPRRAAASASPPSRRRRVVAHAAATISSTSSASGLLNRNISTATGVSARTAPASSPAAGPAHAAHRRVEQRHRARRPSAPAGRACSTTRSRRSARTGAITHSEAGGLSTVIALAESSEPKKNAFQLCVAGLDGGGVERVGPAGGGQVPQVEPRRADQQHGEARDVPTAVATGPVRCAARRACRMRQGGGHAVFPGVMRADEAAAVRGRKTQARKSTNRSTVAARLASTSTASSTARLGVGHAVPEQRQRTAW